MQSQADGEIKLHIITNYKKLMKIKDIGIRFESSFCIQDLTS
jgi:hypothetical protein